ncbi:unnamed protein product, partial [Mesorhabditis belari]|uniref:Innexin n=1 Tax=Mesorhabditis belari TaxID=2138241 RepID=A0AAF3ED12_9BILA
MEQLIGVVTNLAISRNEEDFVDRLNFRFTSYLFAFCSLLITSKLYLGNAIKCWTPNEFKKGWTQYTHDYCLIENTYYLPMDDPLMPGHQTREDKELQYYQWVQFVLILMAFCFYLPHTFWRSVNWQSGIQVKAIVEQAVKFPALNEKERKENIDKVTKHIETSMSYSSRLASNRSNIFMMAFGWVFGEHFMTWMYLITKVLFLVNICLQLSILHLFLGFSPINFLELKMGFNTNWKDTGLFPRSTMCDFEIRTKGNVQRYSVQCVLQLNMFNEKIFLVLYYWLLVLFMVTLGNFAAWILNLFSAANREDFAKKMLNGAGISRPTHRRSPKATDDKDSIEMAKMNTDRNPNYDVEIENYNNFIKMSTDQVLLLRLISSNAGDIAASDVTASLYRLKFNKEKS